MQILHGTWIPQSGRDQTGELFIQSGAFYLWVETTEKKRFRQPSPRHPWQLVAADLALLLKQDLGLQPPNPRQTLADLITPQYFLLPTVEQQPLPSLELSRYLEEDLPEAFEWQYWQVDCYPTIAATKAGGLVNSVVSLLNELHFLALHNLTEIQLGSDLLFWFHYTQALKRLIFKDQYIPALKYRELPAEASPKSSRRSTKAAAATIESATSAKQRRPSSRKATPQTKTKSATKTTRRSANLARKTSAATQTINQSTFSAPTPFEIYPAWEWVGAEYEATLQHYVEYMPLICAAGFAEPRETPEFYDRTTLLRHFSECWLTDLVTHTPTTQAYEKAIADSLLSACLHPPTKPWREAERLEQYSQWQAWRDRIVRTQMEMPFYLCFQLQDPIQPQAPWQLQLQVAPKHDPSLRVALQ
ncbi:MAG: ATP-dependent helicase, partial [Leptolyngbyaceae cyanobacterium SL_7_1]|nr:ATP-dependent helicase [Leptolyngbyaceae cyanobacterium SL_7_1]